METLYFLFTKSIREGNFESFLQCLKEMLPWFFALDHTHYARWLSIFVQDLSKLKFQQTDTYEAFKKGFFTVRKTNRVFSNMGIDQAHEQMNKVLKTDGGVIGILDNPKALLKWAISGPVISELLTHDNDDNDEFLAELHHEDTESFEEEFRRDESHSLHQCWSMKIPLEKKRRILCI